jgi:SAM-dependent methyltransferase
MQVRWEGKPTDFFSDRPFKRADENGDRRFYEKPRFVAHLDDRALEHIRTIYGGVLRPGMKVLDLMSSWRSHVPETMRLGSLVGLGLNEEELKNNPQLASYVVHDLNENPKLPFDDNTFDAIICTSSVEYMTQPLEVFGDCARILKPDGIFIHTFSTRWFPPKVVRIWSEISEFERMGLVMEYFLRTGLYGNLETRSLRGWPRPVSDQYYPRVRHSDPVFSVSGRCLAE